MTTITYHEREVPRGQLGNFLLSVSIDDERGRVQVLDARRSGAEVIYTYLIIRDG